MYIDDNANVFVSISIHITYNKVHVSRFKFPVVRILSFQMFVKLCSF